jgi:hypothetical protein
MKQLLQSLFTFDLHFHPSPTPHYYYFSVFICVDGSRLGCHHGRAISLATMAPGSYARHGEPKSRPPAQHGKSASVASVRSVHTHVINNCVSYLACKTQDKFKSSRSRPPVSTSSSNRHSSSHHRSNKVHCPSNQISSSLSWLCGVTFSVVNTPQDHRLTRCC